MKTISINMMVLLVLLLVIEVMTRLFISYHPGYYTGIKTPNECVEYPYGKVCLNSDGYPSKEFIEHGKKPIVGYFGDSVCFGVGAGMGYRVSDLLERSYGDFEHRNYCYIGDTPIQKSSARALYAKSAKLDHVVIFFNLNDIAPLESEMRAQAVSGGSVTETSDQVRPLPIDDDQLAMISENDDNSMVKQIAKILSNLRQNIYPVDEFLRGRIYTYNFFRTYLKNWLATRGVEATGYIAKELFPTKNKDVVIYAAQVLNRLGKDFSLKYKIRLSVVLLPYEMQISQNAAEVYSEAGIKWESGFLDGSTQQLLQSHVNESIRVFDAREAFDQVKRTAKVGEYFVYNLGDKLDWNHPNRKGHQLIHDYLINEMFLEDVLSLP